MKNKIFNLFLMSLLFLTPLSISTCAKEDDYALKGAVIQYVDHYEVINGYTFYVYGQYERVNGYATNIDLNCSFPWELKPASCSFYPEGKNVRVFITYNNNNGEKEFYV